MYIEEILSKEESIFDIEMVRRYLRIDHSNDDEIIKIGLALAEEYIKDMLGRVISPIKYKITTDVVDSGMLKLKVEPVILIDTITLDGKDLKPEEYSIENSGVRILTQERGEFVLIGDFGLSSSDILLEKIKSAVLEQTAYFYENRGGDKKIISKSVEALVLSLRKVNL